MTDNIGRQVGTWPEQAAGFVNNHMPLLTACTWFRIKYPFAESQMRVPYRTLRRFLYQYGHYSDIGSLAARQ